MKDIRPYITYIPPLLKALEATKGDILELGMGFSTAFLDALCKESKRRIVSYENDIEWYEENRMYQSEYHDIILTNDWSTIPIEDRKWGVVLVDHRPAVRRRVEAKRVKDCADIVVLHDSEPEIDRFYRYSSLYKNFKYRYDYTVCKPNTTLLSNTLDVKGLYA